MISWKAFIHLGVEYDLSHLHPSRIQYVQPAKNGLPEKTYNVEISYSLHCFSKSREPGCDPLLNYSDARETRTFDPKRYELSKQLPQIIQELGQRRCMHTGKGNFFVIEVSVPNSANEEYEVYFDIERSPTKGMVRLFVQSAYVRDTTHGNRLSVTKPISLYVILYNKLNGKPIKVPR